MASNIVNFFGKDYEMADMPFELQEKIQKTGLLELEINRTKMVLEALSMSYDIRVGEIARGLEGVKPVDVE
jgi:hypothetical protein